MQTNNYNHQQRTSKCQQEAINWQNSTMNNHQTKKAMNINRSNKNTTTNKQQQTTTKQKNNTKQQTKQQTSTEKKMADLSSSRSAPGDHWPQGLDARGEARQSQQEEGTRKTTVATCWAWNGPIDARHGRCWNMRNKNGLIFVKTVALRYVFLRLQMFLMWLSSFCGKGMKQNMLHVRLMLIFGLLHRCSCQVDKLPDSRVLSNVQLGTTWAVPNDGGEILF